MTLTHSEQLNELAAALAKAQGEIEGAAKASTNPHFRSKYADLASVWDAVRGPLSAQGIAVVQVPTSGADGKAGLETLMVHSSGQWIRGHLAVTAKDEGPQAAGSCITYLRRYALQSFAGVAPEDDDAEGAEGRNGKAKAEPAKAPAGFDEWLTDLAAVAAEGTARLQDTWKASKAEFRAYLTSAHGAQWDALKARAAKVQVAA